MIVLSGRRRIDVVVVLQRTRPAVARGCIRKGSLVAEVVILRAMVTLLIVEFRRLLILIEHFLRVHIVVIVVGRRLRQSLAGDFVDLVELLKLLLSVQLN